MNKILFILFLCFVFVLNTASNVQKPKKKESGGAACTADSEIAPTADTTVGSWTASLGGSLYVEIDDPIGSENGSEYLYTQDNPTSNAAVYRFTVPGSPCSISSIDVVGYGYTSGPNNIDLNVSVSPDNSNWETDVSIDYEPGGQQTHQFASLTGGGDWSSPTYVYVRAGVDGSTYANFYLQNLAIIINPTP